MTDQQQMPRRCQKGVHTTITDEEDGVHECTACLAVWPISGGPGRLPDGTEVPELKA